MNKYRKEKSREIRDIMRTDPWRRMSYKEAKRKWRKGIRAFPVGAARLYKSFDLCRLGLSRSKIREFGQAYTDIVKYSTAHGLDFRLEYETHFDTYVFYFTGMNYITGKRYGFRGSIASDVIRQSTCSFAFLAKYILEQLDHEVKTKGIGFKPEYKYIPIWDNMVLQPMGFYLKGEA